MSVWQKIGIAALAVLGFFVAIATLGRVRIGRGKTGRLVDDAESLARRARRREVEAADKAQADEIAARPADKPARGESGANFLRRVSARHRDE